MPDGVVNIVPGLGSGGRPVHRRARAASPRSRSPAAPRPAGAIVQASAGNLKKVQLELGGKGANIVFDDANLVAAVNGSAWAIFHNQGQACIAGSRLVLHERIADAFLDKFIALAQVDPPRQPARCRHRDGAADERAAPRPRAGYVDVAREQGGEVLAGGKAPERRPGARLLCRADRRAREAPHDRVAQEEVFGPFVTVLTFKTTTRRWRSPTAPTTAWAAACGPRNLQRAHRFARELRCRHGLDQLATSASTRARRSAASASRLRPRDGLRRDARVHAGEERVGQRRRADPARGIRVEPR